MELAVTFMLFAPFSYVAGKKTVVLLFPGKERITVQEAVAELLSKEKRLRDYMALNGYEASALLLTVNNAVAGLNDIVGDGAIIKFLMPASGG